MDVTNRTDIIMDKISVFKELFAGLSIELKVDLWNQYACECAMDDYIYYNDEDFFNEHFSSPAEAVRATFFGDYRYGDNYVWFNGYANLVSSDYEWRWTNDKDKVYMPIDEDALAHWVVDNDVDLEYYDIDLNDEEEENED